MNKDAHYYATLAFCRGCGFNKESAHIIAYASQFVDDAKINLIFFDKNTEEFEYDTIKNRSAFFNMATCHSYFRMETFNYEAMVNNTSAFHFIPGCQGESFTKRLRCKQESPVILDILNDVFYGDDLIKLGIVLHVYVDTFSHQGFSGILSKVNGIKNCEPRSKVYLGLIDNIQNFFKKLARENFDKYFDRIMPAYGHSQALNFPDIPYLLWSYEYDCSDDFCGLYKNVEIDNNIRYQQAFNNVRNFLTAYLNKHNKYFDHSSRFENFDILMDALVLKSNQKVREMNWRKVLVDLNFYDKNEYEFLNYEDTKWLKEAFVNFDSKVFNNRIVEGVQLENNFSSTNWYGFYQAVKWYKKKFYEYCAKYQLDIPH